MTYISPNPINTFLLLSWPTFCCNWRCWPPLSLLKTLPFFLDISLLSCSPFPIASSHISYVGSQISMTSRSLFSVLCPSHYIFSPHDPILSHFLTFYHHFWESQGSQIRVSNLDLFHHLHCTSVCWKATPSTNSFVPSIPKHLQLLFLSCSISLYFKSYPYLECFTSCSLSSYS